MLLLLLTVHHESSVHPALCLRNVEELVRFTDIKLERILTYGAKQLIAREVS